MPDVKFSNLYPYTDFHELNLDWVIKEVKFWSERVGKSIQTIEKTGTAGLVDTYTITYSDGSTSTFDVTNGNGITSVAKTGTAGLVDTYTITFQDGNTTTFEVHNGTASIDDTLTVQGRAADAGATGENIVGLSSGGPVITPVTWITGYYLYSANGNPTSYAAYEYSDIITLKQGEQLKLFDFKCDTASVVAVICKYRENGQFLSCPYSYPTVGDLPTYTYTATDTIEYIRLCSLISSSPYVAISVQGEHEIGKRLDILEECNIARSDFAPLSYVRNDGYFINMNGSIVTQGGYTYTNNIELNPGDIVHVYSKDASGGAVMRVSEWSAGGQFVKALNLATTSFSGYTLIADHHMYIRLSYQLVNPIYATTASLNIPDVWKIALHTEDPETYLTNISMFENIGYCGDSYVAGQLYNGGTLVGDFPALSWGSDVGRLTGTTSHIYASSGASTATFITRGECLPAILAQPARGLYVFCLGINDWGNITTGTISDIHADYTQNPNTFYGNYGRILAQVVAHAPNSKIILMNPMHPYYGPRYATACQEIATYFGICFIDTATSPLVTHPDYTAMMDGGHPTAALHSAIAKDFINLSSKAISGNYTYFRTYYGVS